MLKNRKSMISVFFFNLMFCSMPNETMFSQLFKEFAYERHMQQNKGCTRFKGCTTFSRNTVKLFDLPGKVQSILCKALMVKHMQISCSESSCFDKAQIHSVSSVKHGEGRGVRRRGVFATVPSTYFIDVGRHRKRAAFTLACRVLLLARESKTISDFWEIRGQLAFPQPRRN